jgi:hypothetical protein
MQLARPLADEVDISSVMLVLDDKIEIVLCGQPESDLLRASR